MQLPQSSASVKRLGEFVTLDGAAQALGLSYWSVYGLIRRNQVPTVKVGRSTLVRLDDLAVVSKESRQDAEDE